MKIDRITLEDLSFLKSENSVFTLLKEGCRTQEGVSVLKQHILNPPRDFDRLIAFQDAVKFWVQHKTVWSESISNGTLVMVQKFYETNDLAIDKPTALSLLAADLMQKIFHKNTQSFALFSITHLADFLKGCNEMTLLLEQEPPKLISDNLLALKKACERPLAQKIINTDAQTSNKNWLKICYAARRQMRATVLKMIAAFAHLDAIHAMALISLKNNWSFPEILPSESLKYEVKQLVHPLLKKPVGYDFSMDANKRFLFLTGANMSGKSTLLYALGIGALLAHLGMGVPATSMRISFLEGIITNMHIEDNILLGESYFFAEVQRMKHTAQMLKNNPYHLVLMDELFKGTNGYDAFECSLSVIKGLLGKTKNLMALSTHLDELSEQLKNYPEILFRYCQTEIDENKGYRFTYRLQEGVSRDRIGFLVLQKEGVLKLLQGNDEPD